MNGFFRLRWKNVNKTMIIQMKIQERNGREWNVKRIEMARTVSLLGFSSIKHMHFLCPNNNLKWMRKKKQISDWKIAKMRIDIIFCMKHLILVFVRSLRHKFIIILIKINRIGSSLYLFFFFFGGRKMNLIEFWGKNN